MSSIIDFTQVSEVSDIEKETLEDLREAFQSEWRDKGHGTHENPPCSFCTRHGDEAYRVQTEILATLKNQEHRVIGQDQAIELIGMLRWIIELENMDP